VEVPILGLAPCETNVYFVREIQRDIRSLLEVYVDCCEASLSLRNTLLFVYLLLVEFGKLLSLGRIPNLN
jgi:hypothetical protein